MITKSTGLRAALTVLAFGSASWCAEMPRELGGKWCTTRVFRTSNVQALTKSEQEALVGTVVEFSTSAFQSGTRRLARPQYQSTRFKARELVDRFMIMPAEIGISAPFLREVDVNDPSGRVAGIPGDTVLIKSSSMIVWYWKGAFFEAGRCHEK